MGGIDRRIFPRANTTAQWYETKYDRSTFTKIDKFLLHTTETLGWPGYDLGAKAPTITYHPRLRAFRQHNFLNTSARALVDLTSTPVRENRDNVVQIEIICYADELKAASVGGLKVSELTDDHLRDIAELYKFLHDEWGTPLQCTLEFPPYRPYKNVRLTSSQYDNYFGLLGHCHAPGNTHTDPGGINDAKILSFAKGATTTKEWWEMTIPAEDLKAIALAVWNIGVTRGGVQIPAIQELADAKTAAQTAAGQEVDEAQVADLVLTGLREDIKGAVENALASVQINADITPEEVSAISDAVVIELNSRLAS